MIKAAKLNRDATLEAVMRCFWTHGYEATTLDRLEKATGLGRQSLYNAFGGKEALFGVALDRYREQVGAPLRALLEQDDPASAIRAFLEAHLAIFSDETSPVGCMLSGCSSELGPRDDTLGHRMREETATGASAIEAVFQRWRSEGRLTQLADPETLAALLSAVIRGLAVLRRASTDTTLVAKAVEGAIQAFAPFLLPSRQCP